MSPSHPLSSREREQVLALLKRHGWNATSFQVLEPQFRYWFHGDDALVAYVDTGGAWVAAGAPVARADSLADVAAAFIRAARQSRRRACFFATEERFHQLTGYPTFLMGEQPVWDPARWGEVLEGSPSLRAQLKRAHSKGVLARVVTHAEIELPGSRIRAGMAELTSRWLAHRPMAPLGFLVRVHPFDFAGERRYVLAEREGKVVGFLVAVPVYARGGWFFEDLLRAPEAPNGTTELLVDAGMRQVAAEGCRYVTLGLAPLSGPVRGWLRMAGRAASGLYDFRGLQRFKSKLRPSSWQPISLAFPPGQLGSLALYDVLAAFASGGLVRFGLSTLSRGPAVVVQALGLLLIPWTVLLAMSESAKWFPSPWVKWGWVLFDAGLSLGLLALAQRWRRGLATLLASLITADAALTLFEAAVFNVPRGGTLGSLAVVLTAVLAPSFAAALLWLSRAHRSGSAPPR